MVGWRRAHGGMGSHQALQGRLSVPPGPHPSLPVPPGVLVLPGELLAGTRLGPLSLRTWPGQPFARAAGCCPRCIKPPKAGRGGFLPEDTKPRHLLGAWLRRRCLSPTSALGLPRRPSCLPALLPISCAPLSLQPSGSSRAGDLGHFVSSPASLLSALRESVRPKTPLPAGCQSQRFRSPTPVCAESLGPCVAPWTVAHRLLFPRQEYWSGLSSPPPGDLPDPGVSPRLPRWRAGSLPLGHLGGPQLLLVQFLQICAFS